MQQEKVWGPKLCGKSQGKWNKTKWRKEQKIWTKLDDATHENIESKKQDDNDNNNNNGDDNKIDDSVLSIEVPPDDDDNDAKEKLEDESQDLFSSVMGDFYITAKPQYDVISSGMTDIVNKCQELGRYFGEKDDTKMEFLNIIQENSNESSNEEEVKFDNDTEKNEKINSETWIRVIMKENTEVNGVRFPEGIQIDVTEDDSKKLIESGKAAIIS